MKGGSGGRGVGSTQNKDGPRDPNRSTTGQDLKDRVTPEDILEVNQRWGGWGGDLGREEQRGGDWGEWKRGALGFREIRDYVLVKERESFGDL